jgi:Zn-dependent peptidase ImmA (M78 family)
MILKECDDVKLQFCDFEYNNVIDGTIEFKNGFYIIKINKNKSEERKRFTMAHEYYHYLFDRTMLKENSHKDLILYRTNYLGEISNTKLIDIRANFFACELLMPELIFRGKNHEFSMDIYKISDFFKVSTLAVKVRYSQLGIEFND